jgi:hypothetical protein
LADSSYSSKFSFVPIPFQTQMRITVNTLWFYYHVSVLKFPAGTMLEPFTMPPTVEYTARRDSLAARFSSPQIPSLADQPANSISNSTILPPSQTATLLSFNGSGTCRRLLLRADAQTLETQYNIRLQVFTDNYPLPDLDCPLGFLFGQPNSSRITYYSAVTGISGDSVYFNLPISFKTSLQLTASNLTTGTRTLATRAEIVAQPILDIKPFKLLGIYHQTIPVMPYSGYELCNFEGRGNFLGVLLKIENFLSTVLEGDESFYLNGDAAPFWRGTGTEDYFNGAYYWQDYSGHTATDRYYAHGCLAYSATHAVAYRWHLTDPVPFTQSLRMSIEVGPFNEMTGNYRSMAFAYALPKSWVVRDASGNGESTAGESIRLIGRSLSPSMALDSVFMGEQGLIILRVLTM